MDFDTIMDLATGVVDGLEGENVSADKVIPISSDLFLKSREDRVNDVGHVHPGHLPTLEWQHGDAVTSAQPGLFRDTSQVLTRRLRIVGAKDAGGVEDGDRETMLLSHLAYVLISVPLRLGVETRVRTGGCVLVEEATLFSEGRGSAHVHGVHAKHGCGEHNVLRADLIHERVLVLGREEAVEASEVHEMRASVHDLEERSGSRREAFDHDLNAVRVCLEMWEVSIRFVGRDEADEFVSGANERGDKVTADESTGSGDEDAHGNLLSPSYTEEPDFAIKRQSVKTVFCVSSYFLQFLQPPRSARPARPTRM